jgi:hypothetical protein
VAGSCKYGDEPLGSGATELVHGLPSVFLQTGLRHQAVCNMSQAQ